MKKKLLLIQCCLMATLSYTAYDENYLDHQNPQQKIHRHLNLLATIIQKYQKDGKLSDKDQSQFVQNFVKVDRLVDLLDSKEANIYHDRYVAIYHDWASYILSAKMYQEFKNLLSDNTQDQGNPTQSESDYGNDQDIAKMKAYMSQAHRRVDRVVDQFMKSVQTIVRELGDYSSQNVSDFYVDINGAVSTFESYMKSIYDQTLSDYFSYVRSVGQSVNPMNLTPIQHSMAHGLKSMIDEALLQVRALVLELVSQTHMRDFENHFVEELEKNKHDQEVKYQQLLNENQDAANKSWWDTLKDSSQSFFSNLGDNLKKKVYEKVVDFGKDLASQIGNNVLDRGKTFLSNSGKTFLSKKK